MDCRQTVSMQVLIDKERVQQRIQEMGRAISADLKGKPVTVIGALKGCFVFMADLVRHIDLPLKIDFIEVSSYGDATESSGQVKIIKDFKHSIAGQHVLMVEDIVDTGLTLNYLLELLKMRQPASISIAALLVKEQRQQVRYPIAYRGFDIGDDFVVGMGMDCMGYYRNLDHIAIVGEKDLESTRQMHAAEP